MKAVMISIKPKWCEKIANGQKTIEVRKTRPKIDTPFKCYIYCTKDFKFNDFKYSLNFIEAYKRSGEVIGEFVCDRILESFLNNNDGWFIEKGCLTQDEIDKYQGDKAILYGWHIRDLVIYDEPKELGEFEHSCPTNLKKIPYINCSYCRYNFVGNRGNKCDCKVTRPPQSWCYVEEKE